MVFPHKKVWSGFSLYLFKTPLRERRTWQSVKFLVFKAMVFITSFKKGRVYPERCRRAAILNVEWRTPNK